MSLSDEIPALEEVLLQAKAFATDIVKNATVRVREELSKAQRERDNAQTYARQLETEREALKLEVTRL